MSQISYVAMRCVNELAAKKDRPNPPVAAGAGLFNPNGVALDRGDVQELPSRPERLKGWQAGMLKIAQLPAPLLAGDLRSDLFG